MPFNHSQRTTNHKPLTTNHEPQTTNHLFMQNKPNLLDAQMNVTSFITKYYENKWQWRVRKNKPNTNPIKPNPRKAQMNVNSLITKDYRKKDDFAVRKNKANSNPIKANQSQSPSAIRNTQYEIRDTNPIKLEANLPLRGRRSLRVSFSESSNRGPISNGARGI